MTRGYHIIRMGYLLQQLGRGHMANKLAKEPGVGAYGRGPARGRSATCRLI
jgi:hypothetical protein